MTTNSILRDTRVLIERYLEVSNHYARESRSYLKELETSPSRLSSLINSLEAIESSVTDATRGADVLAVDEDPQGQNIVPSEDTLAALRDSTNEILERLENPYASSVPRNWLWLKRWLQRDVAEIAAGFPSFTYAWDKLIDLNRLTLVPDSNFLRVRDNVSLATMEFERFVIRLYRLTQLSKEAENPSAPESVVDRSVSAEVALQSLRTSDVAPPDPRFDERVERALKLLQRPKDPLEGEPGARGDASKDVDTLALLGLELGFSHWQGFAPPSKEHRKSIIMSLLVCSKFFLVESSWRNAKEFSAFALTLVSKMNKELALPAAEGTPMLRFNQLWAESKLGENIADDLEDWDVTQLHARYIFLKSVLQKKYDDAVRFLEALLPKDNSGKSGNFSIMEAEEWPILAEFRSSDQYGDLKERLRKEAT